MSRGARLRVGNIDYRVSRLKRVKFKGKPVTGLFDPDAGVICVQSGMPADVEHETELHEAIHAIDHCWEIGLTEKQVLLLGRGFAQVLPDNPWLAKPRGAR